MVYPCLQSLVVCGNTFKRNWNGFCQKVKVYANINIVYEHPYLNFFIMVPLLLMLTTARHVQNMCCVPIYNNQLNLFEKVYHFIFWLQQTKMSPISHCTTSIFEEELKFQYVRGDIHIQIATQNIILTFLSKWHFVWKCKQESLS